MTTSAKPRRARSGSARRAEPDGAPTPRDRTARGAQLLLAGMLCASSLAVDSSAEAAFDAPKRLLILLGTALAAATLLVRAGRPRPAPFWSRLVPAQRAVLILLVIALCGALLAALGSPRRALAVRELRLALVMALLLVLGASRALAQGRSALLAVVFLVVASLNAAASALDRLGVIRLFAVEAVAGRSGTGAFVGNEGSLALVLALAAVAALAILLQARSTAVRLGAAAALVLQLLGLTLNPTLTALLGLLAGASLVAVAVLGRRALAIAGALTAVLALLTAGSPPLRARLDAAAEFARAGDWDALLTYRFGPWAAALEMVRERPLLGFGPGTFGAEFVPHRLRAEIRHHRRFVVPRETSTYAEAHDDYLQAFAEGGLVTGLSLLAALALLLAGLARRLRTSAPDERHELVVVLGVLCAGAIGALTWFPIQQPAAAPVLLLALGRGWRLLAPAPAPAGTPDAAVTAAERATRVLLALLLVALVLLPELRRYAGERALSRASAGVKQLVAAGAAGLPPAQRTRLIDEAAAYAAASSAALPGDERPLLAAAAVDLLAQHPERALQLYGRALALGERAEIDLNVGRAFALQDRRAEAFAAFVRAAWLSPALIPAMPTAAQPLVSAELARNEALLRSGALATPPALPAIPVEPAP